MCLPGLAGLLLLGGTLVVLAAESHSVRILEPPEGLHTGGLRVGAVVEGEGVARVRFLLDGRVILSKTRPPYSVELDLGDAPRPHEVTAIACDAEGRELARDRISINEGPHRFSVRLIAPLAGRRYSGSVKAKADVTLPIGEPLERIEFYVGERLAGAISRPPYQMRVDLPAGEQTYVRAVAYLGDGNTGEDLVSVNAPGDMQQLHISFVELFTSVLDRKRKPVEGLTREDFTVREDGVPQDVRRFERVFDRPVHVGILLDTSTSMLEELLEARKAARTFFERVIRPRDRATVITFADRPQVRVPFSSDLELLAAGLDELQAEGETSLHDSLAFSLYYFGGLKGKRAIVVLTDGADSMSRFSLAEVIEFAQRLGVAVYAIGVTSGTRDFESESGLRRLASETGGSSFFIARAQELERAYERIEAELRSQYLLGYQSTSTVPRAFRRVNIEVAERGLSVQSIPGYYP